MFAAARAKDLDYISELIRDGARSRAFDEALAHDSPESATFFTCFAEVLARGIWTRPAASGPTETPAHAFLYRQTAITAPVGFVAIRGIGALGYEIWLTAIDREIRGQGVGRGMLTEFLDTEHGKRSSVAQCRMDSPGAQACAHILSTLGFTAARVGKLSVWMARSDLPADALHWIGNAPLVSPGSA